jgi:hypothetical protein
MHAQIAQAILPIVLDDEIIFLRSCDFAKDIFGIYFGFEKENGRKIEFCVHYEVLETGVNIGCTVPDNEDICKRSRYSV